MNVSKELNKCILYIEENLDKKIDYKYLSKILGCNISTFQRVFSILTGTTLTEYIRRRRLTVAVKDINNGEKIIDVAFKYGYTSPSSFSRSFYKMHGILPSKIKNKNVSLDIQPILKFNENSISRKISFKIEKINGLTLYGIKKQVDIENIPPVAERLWKYVKTEYPYFNDCDVRYGIIFNDNGKYYYMCAGIKYFPGLEEIKIPKSKWIVFEGKSNNGEEIKNLFNKAYDEYIPNIGFNYIDRFELERYHKDYTEVLMNIN